MSSFMNPPINTLSTCICPPPSPDMGETSPGKTPLCLFISQLQIPDLISILFHFNSRSVVIQEFQFIPKINFPEAITILIRNSWNGCTNATSRSTSSITSKTILNIKTSFKYCLSDGGQNSVIPVVFHVPEQNFYTQHATLSNCSEINCPFNMIRVT